MRAGPRSTALRKTGWQRQRQRRHDNQGIKLKGLDHDVNCTAFNNTRESGDRLRTVGVGSLPRQFQAIAFRAVGACSPTFAAKPQRPEGEEINGSATSISLPGEVWKAAILTKWLCHADARQVCDLPSELLQNL